MLGSRRRIVFTMVAAVALAACAEDTTVAVGSSTQAISDPAITTDEMSYTVGQTVMAEYSGMPGNQYDWVAVATAGSPDTAYIEWDYIDGQTDGSLTFLALPAGDYEARAYVNDSYTVLARSTFTITASMAASVSTDLMTYAPGATVTLDYANLPGNTYDWVAVAPAGSPDTSYVKWDYTDGQVNGAQAFVGLASGQYEARAYLNDTFTVLARSTFAITATAVVSTSTQLYQVDQLITVNFSGLPGNTYDWVAVAPAGSPDTSFAQWKYTGGATSGSSTFAALPAGNYEARAFLNDSFTLLASSTFAVTGGVTTTTISTDSDTYTSADTVTATWANMPGNQTDWVSISVAGSPATSFVQWTYIDGETSGSATFNGLAPGDYEARAYTNDSYNEVASSTFTVTP